MIMSRSSMRSGPAGTTHNVRCWTVSGWLSMVKSSFHGDILGMFLLANNTLPLLEFEAFTMLAWQSWNRRNGSVHGALIETPTDTVNAALHLPEYHRSYHIFIKIPQPSTFPLPQRWRPLAAASLVLSVVSTLSHDLRRCRIFRSSSGMARFSFLSPLVRPLSPLAAEVWAIL